MACGSWVPRFPADPRGGLPRVNRGVVAVTMTSELLPHYEVLTCSNGPVGAGPRPLSSDHEQGARRGRRPHRRGRRGGVSPARRFRRALGEEEDRILGLEVGADDYVTKPFSPRELVLRVQAVVRRAAPLAPGDAGLMREGAPGSTPTPDLSLDGDLVLDRRAHVVTRGGDELAVTAREFALLDWFLRHPGAVQRRDELIRAVWGWEFGDESTVTVHVRRLREKVEAEPSAPRRLVTVFGVGYRWDPRPPDAA